MPRGRGRGKGRSQKGGHRKFTNAEELKAQQTKQEKEKEWRKMKGLPSDESGSEDDDDGAKAASRKQDNDDDVKFGGSSSEEEESSEEEDEKAKGVSHLIEVANPNRQVTKSAKKVTEVSGDAKVNLTRREREELAKQQAKAQYQKMHMEGKTEEARSDLARLALIRKQREDAAKKKDEERKQREAAAAEAEKKLKEKRAAARQQ